MLALPKCVKLNIESARSVNVYYWIPADLTGFDSVARAGLPHPLYLDWAWRISCLCIIWTRRRLCTPDQIVAPWYRRFIFSWWNVLHILGLLHLSPSQWGRECPAASSNSCIAKTEPLSGSRLVWHCNWLLTLLWKYLQCGRTSLSISKLWRELVKSFLTEQIIANVRKIRLHCTVVLCDKYFVRSRYRFIQKFLESLFCS